MLVKSIEMRSQTIYVLLSFFLLASCTKRLAEVAESAPLVLSADDRIKLVFGSCNDEDKPQDMWAEIMKEEGDLWIWLGDNIYGDSEDMAVLQQKYDKQNNHLAYQKFVETIPINGVWDDHDYGVNDGGKEYPMRAESQQLFLDFINASSTDVRRTREGTYGMTEIQMAAVKVGIYYLDTRYFRDELVGRKGKYGANETGTILGESQWAWLSNKLNNSDADVTIIVSSIQVIAAEHGYEKWANFPLERKRLFDLIVDSGVKKPIILSGDRHASELSVIEHRGQKIYDITASSLTNPRRPRQEANQYRLKGDEGTIVFDKNYGVLTIAPSEEGLILWSEIKRSYEDTALRARLF